MSPKYILYLIFIMDNFVGIFITIRFFNNTLLKKSVKMARKIGSLFFVSIMSILLNYLGEYIGNLVISGVIVYYTVGHIYYQGKIYIKAIISVFIVIFSIVTELLTGILITLVFKQELLSIRHNLLFLFLGCIVSKIMLLTLIELIIRLRNGKVSYVSLGSWFLILSIPIISIILSLEIVYEPIIHNEISMKPILICLSMLYINIITFYLFDNIVSKVIENNQYKIKEKQMLMQQEQYQNIISGYDKINKVRHDMKNHLILLDNYLANGDYIHAKEYIGKLNDELDITKKGVISNNIIVDALVNNCIEKAKKQNTVFQHEIFIPNRLNIDDMDLCVVLGNLLDNAIEACNRITDNSRIKRISFEMKYGNNYIFINQENTYNEETIKQVNGNYISSKGDRAGNSLGIGLGNIMNIVDKYDGTFKIESLNDMFCLKIILPNIKV